MSNKDLKKSADDEISRKIQKKVKRSMYWRSVGNWTTKASICVARAGVVLFILANALANIIRWFDDKHITHEMAVGAGVVTLAICLYVYFVRK